MNNINKSKKYNLRSYSGELISDQVQIIVTDHTSFGQKEWPVIFTFVKDESEFVNFASSDGKEVLMDKCYLEEVSPYIDTPVDAIFVVERAGQYVSFRYFALLAEGNPMFFPEGKTSYTYSNEGLVTFKKYRLATHSELQSKKIDASIPF